jgi:hypothetical protein
MTDWTYGTPKQLLAALRPGGWLVGTSGKYPRRLRLHKTDVMAMLRTLSDSHACTWHIAGDPNETGRFARNRRTIVVWLGQ